MPTFIPGDRAMTRFIALLRGINVGGRNRVPMPELRESCEELGWTCVQSYIQSGNLLFDARGRGVEIEAALERAILTRFGLAIPVIVRTAAEWSRYAAGNPFAESAERAPNLVMLALSKKPLARGAVATLRERAASGERVEQVGGAIWIQFDVGVASSKLSPGLLDRAAGSPVTTRNWRSVLKLDELAAQKISHRG